jgi:hypothetical protein
VVVFQGGLHRTAHWGWKPDSFLDAYAALKQRRSSKVLHGFVSPIGLPRLASITRGNLNIPPERCFEV